MTLQEYIKEIRIQHGYSQKFVAEHLHIIRQTYSHYETGRLIPPVNALYNLAKLYGISANALLEMAATYRIGDEFSAQNTDVIQRDFTINTDDLDDYKDFIEVNANRYKKLRQDERIYLYYYNYMNDRRKRDLLTFMKVIKSGDDDDRSSEQE